MPALPDPLEPLDDAELYDTQLVLHLVCGRNRSTLRQKHREKLCTLASLLEVEFTNRNIPSPQAPYKA